MQGFVQQRVQGGMLLYRWRWLTFLFLLGFNLLFAQSTELSPDAVLAKVDGEEITLEELAYAYQKTPRKEQVDIVNIPYDSLRAFLDLYINFRLKVLEAKSRGYDRDSSVLAEIRRHRNSIAIPYFFERVLIDPYVEKVAKRREWELKASVILIGIKDKKDSAEAYARARRLIDSLKHGADFAAFARQYSDDRFTAQKGGELPWVTGGQILREIEDPLYQLKEGEVYPEPIKTRFGFFIVKLLKKEPHIVVRARHILITPSAKRDSAAARQLADSLLQLLRNGADFAELAKKFSDDKYSAPKGGDLGGYYSRSLGFMKLGARRLVPEFEEAMFALKDGEISDVVQTSYGFHIIRRDSSKRIRAEDVVEDVKRYYKTTYFQQDRKRFLDSMRKVLGYGWNEFVFQQFIAGLDTNQTTLDSAWDAGIPDVLKKEVLYRTPYGGLTVGAWIDSLKTLPKYRGVGLKPRQMRSAINRAMELVLLEDLTKDLEKQYPEFARLMREFHDGILLFRVENEEVWSKLRFDSARARAYYDSTKDRYWTGDRYDISEIYVLSKKEADSLLTFLKAHPDKFDSVAAARTQRRGYREKQGYWGELDSKQHPLAQKIKQHNPKQGEILLVPYERGYSIVLIHRILPPRQKTFEEAIPDFATQLQDQMQQELTQRWIAKLRKKFPVWINEELIRKVWKK